MKCHDVSGRDLITLLAAGPPTPKGEALASRLWARFQTWVDWAFQTEADHLPKPFQEPDHLPKAKMEVSR
jgi:hypothetical protein